MNAADIMTVDPVTIPVTASIADAVDVLASMHVRHLPVVDASGALVGVLTDRDLGRLMTTFIDDAEVEQMETPPSEQRVADLMSPDPVTVTEDADLAEIAEILVTERVGAVPVVDDADRVVGIVSYVDILRELRREATELGRDPFAGRAPRVRPPMA